MERLSTLLLVSVSLLAIASFVQAGSGVDVIKTSGGDLEITRLGHASLMFKFGGKVIHVDPFGKVADYSKLPKADLVLITHDHRDHLDPAALKSISTKKTQFVLPKACANTVKGGMVMSNGDTKTVLGLKIEAVPMYNIVHKRPSGEPFHPKGRGNGYVITFGDKRVYIAGDTENIPEMKALKDIDVAFLPVNLPYTMTAAMAADAAKAFRPKILYPYHNLGRTDLPKLVGLMKGVKGIELRMPKGN
jgi:L-ascorbate metabolism protein UlaG (beta-lactamase superfamily)